MAKDKRTTVLPTTSPLEAQLVAQQTMRAELLERRGREGDTPALRDALAVADLRVSIETEKFANRLLARPSRLDALLDAATAVLDGSAEARAAPQLATRFRDTRLSRLSLVPVHFSSEFEQRLRETEPLCIVADTNTLYHGSLVQALQLRKGAATHVALADQVLMELQKQRETAYTKKRPRTGTLDTPPFRGPEPKPTSDKAAATAKRRLAAASKSRRPKSAADKATNAVSDSPRGHPTKDVTPAAASANDHHDRWYHIAKRASMLAAGGRAIKRIRAMGHIVHIARPPDVMVRYFGGGRHAGEGAIDNTDEIGDIVGSNALRDRLVLEAAVRQRIALPGVQVWILTDDALLAAQARLEGLSVGFSWLPTGLDPAVVTSPFFSPRLLQLQHVDVDELLQELIWSCGNVALQKEGERRRATIRVPEDRRQRPTSARNKLA